MSFQPDSAWISRVTDRDAGTAPEQCPMYVDGEWVAARSGGVIDVVDPATGRVVARQQSGTGPDVDRAVAAARRAFDDGPWPRLAARDRERLLLEVARLLRENRGPIARLEAVDAGKLYAGALWDVDEAAFQFEYYAGWATKVDGEIPQGDPDSISMIVREPVGVAALIVPWNFPLLLATQKIAPALAVGCTVVVKPAEQTPLSMIALAGLLEQAGLPAGVFNVLTGYGEQAGAPLAAHPGINKVSFTGSTAVGKQIMKSAADNMTRVSLELGGKGPSIVLADADFDAMIDGAAKGIFWNQGQVCGSTSRLLVDRSLYRDALDALAKRAESLVLGHGLDEDSTMGPLVSEEHRRRVAGYVQLALEEGATVAGEGTLPDTTELSGGSFHRPLILGDVRNEMRVAQEEIFGPVLSVIPVDGIEEAVAAANDTIYGLTASIWTRDIDKAFRVAKAVRSGSVWINDSLQAPSEGMFGGFKQSGFGRELGKAGLEEYLESKHVFLRLTPSGGS